MRNNGGPIQTHRIPERVCHLCLLKYKCYLCFILPVFYFTVSSLLKTSSGCLQMGRCLGEQSAGGTVERESNEMDFLPFVSLGNPGCARRERAGEEGRAAAMTAAESFPCSPGALDPRAGRSLWLILFPSLPQPRHTLLFKTLFCNLVQGGPALCAMASAVISLCPLWCRAV